MSVRKIRGLATDAGKNPLPGALVECTPNDDGIFDSTGVVLATMIRTVADVDGHFFLYLEPNSEYSPSLTAYQLKITSGAAAADIEFVVTEDPYPIGQDYLDLATLIVGEGDESPGDNGPVSAPDATFTQSTPASTWTINHSLNRSPLVIVVIDAGGTEVIGFGETYPSLNQVVLSFASPIAGSAYLT